MAETTILVVDDDAEMRQMLREYLEASGYGVVEASSAEGALAAVEASGVDLVITDLRMERMDGLELIHRLVKLSPITPVIMMTAFGSIETAIEAIKAGAHNFITKPFKMASLKVLVDRALEEKNLRSENVRLRREVGERYSFRNLVGHSRAMQEVYDLIERVSDTASNVLVLGESGTGKELVARAVHYSGPRASKPFVAINCTSLPESLLESELFGHVKGSFTGAVANKQGLIQAADGGTLFLDEIGDLYMHLQAKLLRVLEDHEVRPVGAVNGHRVDVRVIAATHRDLERAVQRDNFREDLYYRLNVITIRIPPLRARAEDIPLLARHFLGRDSERLSRNVRSISPEALNWLMERPWRGNVRELENVIERAVVLARGDVIEVDALAALDLPALVPGAADVVIRGRPTLDELEDRYIAQMLEECGGDKQKAAKLLGISTRTLYRRDKH